MFWSYVILLLPLIVALAFILICRVRRQLVAGAASAPGWFEHRWPLRIGRAELDCIHPVVLEFLTGYVRQCDPRSSGPIS